MKSKIKSLNFTNFTFDKALAETNARISLGGRLGDMLNFNNGVEAVAPTFMAPSGIYSQRTLMTIGSTADGFLAPINKAARALYAKYWAKNSSISSFQEMDIAMYTFTSAQLVALIGWLKTIYRACFTHNVNSKYVNEVLVESLGVNRASLEGNLNNLDSFINEKIVDLRGVVLDASIPLYQYAMDMYSHVLKDSPNTAKTQYYTRAPHSALMYVKDGENIGSMKYEPIVSSHATRLTFDEIKAKVNTVFNAFFSSYTIGAISAALEKVYPNESSRLALPFNEKEKCLDPFFDEAALYRIRNSQVLGAVFPLPVITQDILNRTLNCEFVAEPVDYAANGVDAALYKVYAGKHIIHAPNVLNATPEDMMVILSNTPAFQKTADGLEMSAYGVEVVKTAAVYSFKSDSESEVVTAPNHAILTERDTVSALRIGKRMTEFDFVPDQYLVGRVEVAPGMEENTFAFMTDYDFSAVKGFDTIAKVHLTAIYAILGVPET